MRIASWMFGLAVAALGVSPGTLSADTPARSDVTIRIKAPVDVPLGDTLGTVWIIGSDATIAGTVSELVVIDGTAKVDGAVLGNLVLLKSSAHLGSAAQIGKDVLLYRSTVDGAARSIGGAIHNEDGVSFGARALWLVWLSITVAVITIGLLFGYVARGSLTTVADGLAADWRGTIVATLAMVCVLPLAAFLSFLTGIGFVIGIFILFVLIPALSVVGYFIAGTSLGRAFMQSQSGTSWHLYKSIAFGMFLLQLAAMVPGIGGLVIIIASQVGAGSLVSHLWKRNRIEHIAPHIIVQPA